MKMLLAERRPCVPVLKRGNEVAEAWKYIMAAFVITILMTSILVLLLPDTPLEFW